MGEISSVLQQYYQEVGIREFPIFEMRIQRSSDLSGVMQSQGQGTQPGPCAFVLPSTLGGWPEKGGCTPKVPLEASLWLSLVFLFGVSSSPLGAPHHPEVPHLLSEWPQLKACPLH